MKTSILVIILCTLTSVTNGQVFPRYCDLSVNFTAPDVGTIVQSPTFLSYQFKVKNNGPDSLFASDSIRFRPTHSFVQGRLNMRVVPINSLIVPGDSFLVEDTIYIDGYEDRDIFEIFFSYSPGAFGAKNPNRPLYGEFLEDQKNNNDVLLLIHRKPKTGSVEILNDEDFSLYPNPIIGTYFTLASEVVMGEIELRVLDCLGRQVFSMQTNKMEEKLNVQLPQMQAGIYFISIKKGGELWNKKVIIQD